MVGTTEKAYDSAIGLVILAHLATPDLEKFIHEFNIKESTDKKAPELMDIFKEISNKLKEISESLKHLI